MAEHRWAPPEHQDVPSYAADSLRSLPFSESDSPSCEASGDRLGGEGGEAVAFLVLENDGDANVLTGLRVATELGQGDGVADEDVLDRRAGCEVFDLLGDEGRVAVGADPGLGDEAEEHFAGVVDGLPERPRGEFGADGAFASVFGFAPPFMRQTVPPAIALLRHGSPDRVLARHLKIPLIYAKERLWECEGLWILCNPPEIFADLKSAHKGPGYIERKIQMTDSKKNSGDDESYRSAKTAQYVTPKYAKSHPATTVGEKRK